MSFLPLKRSRSVILLLIAGYCVLAHSTQGQTSAGSLSQFGAVDNLGVDTVDLGSGTIFFDVPMFHKPGRGLALDATASYSNIVWPVQSTSFWQTVPLNLTGTVSFFPENKICVTNDTWTFIDAYHITHNFPTIRTYTGNCKGVTPVLTGTASDGSGLVMTVPAISSPTATITLADGATLVAPIGISPNSTNATDANGNAVAINSTSLVDTTGDTIQISNYLGDSDPSCTNSSIPPESYTLNDSNGNVETASIGFGKLAITWDPPNPCVWKPQSFTLPNGTDYQFQYEVSGGNPTGRISSITLPTGGTIQYSYVGTTPPPYSQNGYQWCPTTCSVTRTTSDGSWTYTFVYNSTTSPTGIKTTVVDPLGNTTVYTSIFTYSLHEGALNQIYSYVTSKSVYQGAAQGTPLVFQETCYNGFARPCSNETAANMPAAPSGAGMVTDEYTSYNGGPENRKTTDYLVACNS
jgi:hypothetical protein